MLVVDLRSRTWSDTIQVFPDELLEDKWLGFHGTSSINEAAIEKEGIRWNVPPWSVEDLKRIAAIFRRMEWPGRDSGGYPVLKVFTLKSDYHGGHCKPIFIGETAERCVTFATRDFAGGETARALRRAFRDLSEFLAHEHIRKEWRATRWRNRLARLGTEYPEWIAKVRPIESTDEQLKALVQYQINAGVPGQEMPWPEDLAWIEQQVRSLAGIAEHAAAMWQNHRYGVIYAIKFSEADLATLEDRTSMGIAVHSPIPVDRIMAKAIVPIDATIVHREADRLIELLEGPSLVSAVRAGGMDY